MRVSNALIINKHKGKDSFIKKIIDDSNCDFGKQKRKESIMEENSELNLDFQSHLIEMTPQNAFFKSKEPDGEQFENFYK